MKITLGVFIDLSKAFDTVDHSILLKKLEMYDINTTNLAWFASYLNGRKQYIKITEYANTVKKRYKVRSAARYKEYRYYFYFLVLFPVFVK